MTNKFAYTNEEEKSYGLTGMALSMFLWDRESMLSHISLDPMAGDSIEFSPDFYFCANPRYSAKITWGEMLRQYKMLMGLVMGNVMCRTIVLHRKPMSPEIVAQVYDLVKDEGIEECQLEKDEIDQLFKNTMGELQRLFSNYRIYDIVGQFVKVLRARRTMSGSDVIDQIQILQR